MLESEVEKYLCRRVKNDLHGRAFKFVSPGFNGVPDRIVLVPLGRIYFAETKAPGKKLRKLQDWVTGIIQDLGFEVWCLDTKPKVDEFIKRIGGDGYEI